MAFAAVGLPAGVAAAGATAAGALPAHTATTVTTSAPAAASTAGGNDTATAALLAARRIADGAAGGDVVDPAVSSDLGYRPVVERYSVAKGSGSCSSPVPLPRSFEPACRVHDLGYDLLRVAHRHRTPIPSGLRADLDDLLARQMRDSCEGRALCTAMARIAHTAVRLNTARQGHGAPVEESLPW